MTRQLTIGQLSRETGCKVPTVRYYEAEGLIAPLGRTAGNQRRYGRAQVERLRFIRHARDLGFSLEAVRELLSFQDRPEQDCAEADRLARQHLKDVESRLQRLRALKAELERIVSACEGGVIGDCRVMACLADHQLCSNDRH